MPGFYRKKRRKAGPNKNQEKVQRGREAEAETHAAGTLATRFPAVRGVKVRIVVTSPQGVVLDETEKRRVLDLFVDATLPCRAAEVRAMTDQELRLTMVVRVHVDEASAKVSAGPTDDDADDVELSIWSGTVPARLAFDPPITSSDGAMASGTIEVPASVRRLTKETS